MVYSRSCQIDFLVSIGGALNTGTGTGYSMSAAATRAAVLEICATAPGHNEPLTVSPSEAPPSTVDAKTMALISEIKKAVDDAGAVSAEARAHMDEFTLARFAIARDLKLSDAVKMFSETMAWREARCVNALRGELHPRAEHEPSSVSAARHAAAREHFFAGWGGCCKDGSPFFVEQLGRFDVAGTNQDAVVFDLMMVSEPARKPHATPCPALAACTSLAGRLLNVMVLAWRMAHRTATSTILRPPSPRAGWRRRARA